MDGLEAADTILARQDLNSTSVPLSILIVSYNVKDDLRQCLDSLRDGFDSFEIIVVDNHSLDGTVEMLRREFPEIKLIENRENCGFARAANQGIACSKGQFLLLLNPDTKVNSGGLCQLTDFLERDPRVGILGCQIVDAAGKRHYSGRSFPGFTASFSNSQSILNRLMPDNPWSRKYLLKDLNLDKPTEVDWVSGSCMLVRRKVFEEIGHLDTRFFMFVEDVDFCRRTKQAGWQVVYFSQVSLLHNQGRSVRQRKLKMLAVHHKSMYQYYLKYYDLGRPVNIMVLLGIWFRLGITSLSYWIRN
jgi:GT2 family glycosyltransferase